MPEEKFLVVRLSSMGDVVHTLPAVAALRESFPRARLDWVVDRRWAALLRGNPDLSEVIALDRDAWSSMFSCVRRLRAVGYTCAIDFQSLYKSAALAWLSGAPLRIGFVSSYARESGAALFYTQRVAPRGRHKVEHNHTLAAAAGAERASSRTPLPPLAVDPAEIAARVVARGPGEYFVVSPGGGWRSKCWPAERYGEIVRTVARQHGWRAVVNYGPGEGGLAEAVRRAAAPEEPALFSADVPELMALLSGARFVVAGDTGPLHLAVALGTPVVALYGPTDPARNGPFGGTAIVVRNATSEETTYKRGAGYSPSMLSISTKQVLAGIERLRTMR